MEGGRPARRAQATARRAGRLSFTGPEINVTDCWP